MNKYYLLLLFVYATANSYLFGASITTPIYHHFSTASLKNFPNLCRSLAPGSTLRPAIDACAQVIEEGNTVAASETDSSYSESLEFVKESINSLPEFATTLVAVNQLIEKYPKLSTTLSKASTSLAKSISQDWGQVFSDDEISVERCFKMFKDIIEVVKLHSCLDKHTAPDTPKTALIKRLETQKHQLEKQNLEYKEMICSMRSDSSSSPDCSPKKITLDDTDHKA